MGQNAKICGLSLEFCHCGPFVEFGLKGGVNVRKTLDLRAHLAPGHFPTVVPILEPGKGYEKFLTPKGLNITAQGKRSAALGWDGNNNPNPEGVA
jgi:hypothetical protein